MFDVLIKNARVYDGTGSPAYFADLAVKDGKIAAIGKDPGPAEQVVDAEGLALSPGFIDCHSHADGSIFHDPHRVHALQMGVTTEIAGNCGHSRSPVSDFVGLEEKGVLLGAAGDGYEFFDSFQAECDAISRLELGTNLLLFTGHSTVRTAVMGLANRRSTPEERKGMEALLKQTMEEGALGFTTGLSYVPGIYADTGELIGLAKAIAPYGGIYSTHSRSESAALFGSVQECIDIAREAGIAVNISHFKAVGREFLGDFPRALAMIDEANRQGLRVTMDAYPYTAVSTVTTSAIPAKFLDKGREAFAKSLEDPNVAEAIRREIFEIDDPGWDNSANHVGLENFLIVGAEATPWAVGKTYAQVGQERGITPFAAMIDLLRANDGFVRDVRFAMTEENVELVLRHPLCCVGSDGIYVRGRDKICHPRAFGTFPRYLGRYIRQRGILSREEGIRRITGLPADRFGVKNKGYLKVGYDADLCLFDYDTVIDHADYRDPFQRNEGIRQVWQAGRLVMEDNTPTGAWAGRCLKRSEK